jgi:trimeric autotransporter adhesin
MRAFGADPNYGIEHCPMHDCFACRAVPREILEPARNLRAIVERTTATTGMEEQMSVASAATSQFMVAAQAGGSLGNDNVINSLLRFSLLVLLSILLSSCNGFFVDPTLSSVTVTPSTPSVAVDSSKQMTATGTYNDGSTKNITGSVTWSSDDTTVATVSDGGSVSGISPGKVSVTATSGTISGSTSVTVMVANLRSIAISPTSASIGSDQTEQFTAIGTLDDGTTVDITDAVTWKSSKTSVATINSGGLATAQGTGTTNITATSGSITSNTAVLTVN